MNKESLLKEFNLYADVMFAIRKRKIDERMSIDMDLRRECYCDLMGGNFFSRFIAREYGAFRSDDLCWGDKFHGLPAVYKGESMVIGNVKLTNGDAVFIAWLLPVDRDNDWVASESYASFVDFYDHRDHKWCPKDPPVAVDIKVRINRRLKNGSPAKREMDHDFDFDDFTFS
jgi:hypothetical protein